jgi:hypothetical protein
MSEDPRHLRISWSQLRSHEECRQRAYLLRTGHRSAAADMRAFFPGMVCDEIMGVWLDDPDRRCGGMQAKVADTVDSLAKQSAETGDGVVRWRGPDDKREVIEYCTETLRRLEPILRKLVLPYEFLAHHRFNSQVAIPYLDGELVAVTLTGEMDLLTSPTAGNAIYDLKVTKDKGYWRKVVGQLLFYDLADILATGRRPLAAGLIQPACDEQVLVFQFSDDDRRRMQARIVAYATDAWRKDHPVTTEVHRCGWCPVRHACPRYTCVSLNGSSLSGALRAQARGAA